MSEPETVDRSPRWYNRLIAANPNNADAMACGHPLLVPAAIDAVKQWVYQPTLLNGAPIEVLTAVTVPFNLDPSVIVK